MSGADPRLQGNFAPVRAELTVDEPLPLEGAVPPALEGLLVRNGPNPALAPCDWFSGDGMVHAVELRDGKALSYRNRWVRTRKLASELGTPPPPGPAETIDGPANTHVLWHGGKLLALAESGFPHRLTVDLDTLGVENFDGALTSPMTAHPHVDPGTGGMAFFGYDVFGPPFLRYHELDAAGSLVHSTDLDVPRATMQHDFGVTARRVAFLDLPVVFDPASSGLPFRWDPEAGARIGILDRGDAGTAVRWIGMDPCYVFHVMNAFDDGPVTVLDVCCYQGTFSSTLPSLERWRIDPLGSAVERTRLDDRTVELPRIDDTLAGRPYRFGYCTEISRSEGSSSFDALVRYDFRRDEAAFWDPGPGMSPGEPIFVRAPEGRSDDEGWVLSVVYDASRDSSYVVILDASSFGSAPEAVIHLPCRVPFGFHGSWIPADRYR